MSATTADHHRRLSAFLVEHVIPAEETYRQLSEQARNGLATGLDVSAALVELTRARMERTRLQYQIEIAKLALQTAIGQFPIELGAKP